MEKMEYNLVRGFIIDLGEFLEDKKAEEFNWGFIEDKFYLLKENDIFSDVRQLEISADYIKNAILEKSINKFSFEFEQKNIKYLINIYEKVKKTNNNIFISDFNRVVSECYFKIFKSMVDWNNEDNTLYINDVNILEFLDDFSSKDMSDKQKEIANEWGVELDTTHKQSMIEIAKLIRDKKSPKNFRIGLNWKNLSEAREIAFDI